MVVGLEPGSVDSQEDALPLCHHHVSKQLFSTRWGALLITLAVVLDAILVTLRYSEERKFRRKFQKSQSEVTQNSFGKYLTHSKTVFK